MINDVINKYQSRSAQPQQENLGVTHVVYYQNQMSSSYKTDERVLHSIIQRNVQCRSEEDKVKVRIYYKNRKVSNLIMKNNSTKTYNKLQSTNVLYKFTCPHEDCKLQHNVEYIGMTTTTLSRRLTCHLSSGGPKEHMRGSHLTTLTRKVLEDNTQIIKQYHDPTRLAVAEALLIKEATPVINSQTTGFARTLKLFN
jgi:hypothetical protein